ncbi:MAG TPA: PRC-barrel domain-containing protein [Longimicrobiales bacterium]|nr:PRC-barrel domain-containing protein [Longimicrobiales bacterium]
MTEVYGHHEAEPLSQVSDLRGTPVVDVEGAAVGSVFGALAEVNSGLIRYLDVAIERLPKHVLVPIGHARVDREEGGARVKLRAATIDDLDAVPTYDPAEGRVDEPFERSVLSSLGRLFYGERYYAHPAYDHNGLYAGDHPIVRIGEPAAAAPDEGVPGLVPLRQLAGYRIADGAPDVRGWSVIAGDGTAVGTVGDLVVDTDAETIRYLVIADGRDAAVLIPVGYSRIDKGNQRVELPVLAADDLESLRVYQEGDPVSRAVENTVRTALEELLSGPRRFDRADFAENRRG